MVKAGEITRGSELGDGFQALVARLPAADQDLVARADAWVQDHLGGQLHPDGAPLPEHARGAATTLAGLRVDGEAIAATLLLGARLETREQREAFAVAFGDTVLSLVQGVQSMGQMQVLRGRVQQATDRTAQLESLRKMLLAMVQDIRVVLVKLADQLQCMRELARGGAVEQRVEAARDTLDLFAPLANRLGVWQFKWELEDLAFRCTD